MPVLKEGQHGPECEGLKKLLTTLEPGSSVLDLGFGSGDPADIETSKEHRVTGVNISQTQINLARHNFPAGRFLYGDAGSVDLPPTSFDAVISSYGLEHIPRKENKAILRRIYEWLWDGGLLLISIEASDPDDVMDQSLGMPMFSSCFDPETMKQMVNDEGFDLLKTSIETQVEQSKDVPLLWLLGRKRSESHTMCRPASRGSRPGYREPSSGLCRV